MRFSPPEWHRGKSGGLRVCYVHYPEFQVIVLAIVYAKNEQADLTVQQKSQIRDFIERQRTALEAGRFW
jgi:hypothetical protein